MSTPTISDTASIVRRQPPRTPIDDAVITIRERVGRLHALGNLMSIVSEAPSDLDVQAIGLMVDELACEIGNALNRCEGIAEQ